MMNLRGMAHLARLFLYVLLLVAPSLAHSADQNGYTARYECRAGNASCNVDVAALSAASCDQVISPGTQPTQDWSSIDWRNNVICIGEGDHIARGTLHLQSSGTNGARKILRYYRASDNDDQPWHQTNRARISAINFNGQDYWLLHRLTIDSNGATPSNSEAAIFLSAGSDNNILNRLLVQNARSSLVGGEWRTPTYYNVVQNSVIRSSIPIHEGEPNCIDPYKGQHWYIVNNEAYDCHKVFSIGAGVDDNRGMVLENNDFYVSTSRYTDCNGSYNGNGPCSTSEAVMSIKSGGKPDAPVRHIQNRIWGGRTGDSGLIGPTNSCNGSAVSISRGEQLNQSASWLLFQNNIVMDSQQGLTGYWGPNKNDSTIGNIVYRMRRFNTACDATYGVWLSSKQYGEWYLNTIIDTQKWLTISGSDTSGGADSNNDVRCNVIISGGSFEGAAGSGTIVDSNAFYNTSPYTNGGSGQNIVPSVKQRSSSTSYNVGDILVLGNSENCNSEQDVGCFMYKVISPGVSDSGGPNYCTSLGCIANDGALVVQAVRGPYTFFRKLRTGPEQFVIPYAKVHSSAPEAKLCPTDYADRRGVGITD